MSEEQNELKTVVQGNIEFTKQLYTYLAKKQGNIFFSPISVHAILSLASQGARGDTQEALAKVLQIPSSETAGKGYKDVMTQLNSIKEVTLLMANKVFLKKTVQLREDFQTAAVQQFSSEVDLVDFEQPELTADTINSWAENKTNKKICNLIHPEGITRYTALLLVNAIYFKGFWDQPFLPEFTHRAKFYIDDKKKIKVKMMHVTAFFNYKKDKILGADILELPYTNRNFKMVIILPIERNGIGELERNLMGTDMTEITKNMSYSTVQLALPKFKIEQTIDLKDALTQLGLGVIFEEGHADFSGIIKSPHKLWVSKVVQKIFIEVNEWGSEAAASTAIPPEIPCSVPPRFKVDHPFIACLQFCQKGMTHILFKGRISRPEY